jgi:TatA/E family protein of Tat protein translocase
MRLENPLFWLLLAAVALIIFGPKRLPELGEGLGKAINSFRKATSEVGDTVKDAVKGDTAPKSTGTTYTPSGHASKESHPAPPPESPQA